MKQFMVPKSVFVSVFKYCTCQSILTFHGNLSGGPTPADSCHSHQRVAPGLVRLVSPEPAKRPNLIGGKSHLKLEDPQRNTFLG